MTRTEQTPAPLAWCAAVTGVLVPGRLGAPPAKRRAPNRTVPVERSRTRASAAAAHAARADRPANGSASDWQSFRASSTKASRKPTVIHP